MTDGAGASYGMGMINLKPWDERTVSMQELIATLEEKTKDITDATYSVFSATYRAGLR